MKQHGAMVYVVDDDESVCRSLNLLLKTHGFRVQTFTRAAEFLAFDHPRITSCLLLDVRIPDLNGPVLQDIMADRKLNIPIVFISGHGSISIGVKAMKRGAVDFIQKPFSDRELLNAIDHAIARSKTQNKDFAEIAQINQRMRLLSPRELEVFHFVAQGMLNKQIASKRGTSLQTIKIHRSRVMHKMQAKTVTELIHFAQITGVVPS